MSNLTEIAKENGAYTFDPTGTFTSVDTLVFTPAQLQATVEQACKPLIDALDAVENVLGGEDGFATANAPLTMNRVMQALIDIRKLMNQE